MATVIYHLVLNSAYRSEAGMRRVVSAAGLTNVNEKRARFFDFSVITAHGSPGAMRILQQMPEVSSVQVDGEKHVIDGAGK